MINIRCKLSECSNILAVTPVFWKPISISLIQEDFFLEESISPLNETDVQLLVGSMYVT